MGAILSRNQFLATTHVNRRLCREHYLLELALDRFPPTEPGQFIQIYCRPSRASYHLDATFEWPDAPSSPLQGASVEFAGPLAFLRRPFSLAGRREQGGRVNLQIIHRVVGVGTDWLSQLQPGDAVDILGPLGNRFIMPADGASALMVGGGVGIPPMLYLAEALGRAGLSGVAFAGALTRDLLPLTLAPGSSEPGEARPAMCVAEFEAHGIPSVLATDDGSIGFRGFVTQALEKYLDDAGIARLSDGPTTASQPRPVIYTCGPEPMMKRVATIAAERGLACQVAVERAMACGMGTCQSCCIRVRKPDPSQPPLAGRDWCYRLACTDGPVFAGSDLLW